MTEHDKDEVRKRIKAELAQHLQDRVRRYRHQRGTVAAFLHDHPQAPARTRQADREAVATEIQTLTTLWSEILPYVRHIKTFVPDLLEQTRLCACYLLFGKISNGLAAIFVLGREGFHYEVMEIVRSNREAIDLIHFFAQELADSISLKKWFDGEIILNAEAREALEIQLADTAHANNLTVSLSEVKSGIYRTLSKYSHVSYGALLEAYDVLHLDFDFDRFAGYHYVRNTSLPYVAGEIHGAIIALKALYASIPDPDSYVAVDAILRKYAPYLYDEEARKARNADIEARFKKQ